MASTPGNDLTTLVNDGVAARDAAHEVWAAHYPELRNVAGMLLAREQRAQTLQPTALVHEAWLRLIDQTRVTDEGTRFFRSCFASECRRILVDRARARLAGKRGGGAQHETLCDVSADLEFDAADLLALSDAIEALGQHKERLARVVDLRVFGGLTMAECAEQLGVTTRTIDTDWAFARAWLRKRLAG